MRPRLCAHTRSAAQGAIITAAGGTYYVGGRRWPGRWWHGMPLCPCAKPSSLPWTIRFRRATNVSDECLLLLNSAKRPRPGGPNIFTPLLHLPAACLASEATGDDTHGSQVAAAVDRPMDRVSKPETGQARQLRAHGEGGRLAHTGSPVEETKALSHRRARRRSTVGAPCIYPSQDAGVGRPAAFSLSGFALPPIPSPDPPAFALPRCLAPAVQNLHCLGLPVHFSIPQSRSGSPSPAHAMEPGNGTCCLPAWFACTCMGCCRNGSRPSGARFCSYSIPQSRSLATEASCSLAVQVLSEPNRTAFSLPLSLSDT